VRAHDEVEPRNAKRRATAIRRAICFKCGTNRHGTVDCGSEERGIGISGYAQGVKVANGGAPGRRGVAVTPPNRVTQAARHVRRSLWRIGRPPGHTGRTVEGCAGVSSISFVVFDIVLVTRTALP